MTSHVIHTCTVFDDLLLKLGPNCCTRPVVISVDVDLMTVTSNIIAVVDLSSSGQKQKLSES